MASRRPGKPGLSLWGFPATLHCIVSLLLISSCDDVTYFADLGAGGTGGTGGTSGMAIGPGRRSIRRRAP